MMIVYHIIENKEVLLRDKKYYAPSTLGSDKFTHLSLKHQVARVANSLYHQYSKLFVLEIESSLLDNEQQLVMEDLYQANEDFPHYYGAINLSAIIHIHKIEKNKDGVFEF